MIVNNKIKQFFQGNWGKPSVAEKCRKIDLDYFESEPRFPAKKKKVKKEKKPYVYEGNLCPFCRLELPVDEEALKKEPKNSVWTFWQPRVKQCPNCKGLEVLECPACKRKTWFNPITFIYKHSARWTGCGFEGKKK